MNSSGASANAGSAAGGQIEDAEEESSSSSSTLTVDELENFRQKWQQDLTKRKKSSSGQALNPETEEEESIEEKARNYFLEGVEHEQNGELFEAIQKYRKA